MSKEKKQPNNHGNVAIATFGGGCFWCMEAIFDQIRGILNVESGYAGGETVSPTYEQVCNGTTGHAEVVQVTFNPELISFKEILEIFFAAHDPTTLNRQGADVGIQYRSVIFFHNKEQKKIAEQMIKELISKRVWNNTIVTQVEEFKNFHKAEEYHSKYFSRNPEFGYCRVVIAPKISKLRKKFREKLKEN